MFKENQNPYYEFAWQNKWQGGVGGTWITFFSIHRKFNELKSRAAHQSKSKVGSLVIKRLKKIKILTMICMAE